MSVKFHDILIAGTPEIDLSPAVGSNNAVSSSGVATALNAKAPLNSPALTGTPTGPTAAAGTNTTQLATTAFVINEIAGLGEIVTGPANSTDNAIARFDGTTGKIIQNSSVTISDDGNIFTTGMLDISNSGTASIVATTNGADTWMGSFNHFAPNLPAGGHTYFSTGVSSSQYNNASIHFNYVGDGSDSNSIGLSLYGKNNILRCYGTGNVSIGTDVNTHKLYVDGTTYINGLATATEIKINNGQTSKGVSLQYDQTLEVLNFVFS